MEKGATAASTGGGGGGGVGPTGFNSGGANEVVGHIYRDDVSSPNCVGGENFARGCISSTTTSSTKSQQPFDIFSSPHFKSPGLMAASVEFPFTSDQWKELERQAMIYKYMISSVPVPPHLLFPSSPSLVYNSGYSRNGDLEPGRCKRTDGKKWRCSRDVAPNQKYCERHLHRGRPRSRKPVEAKNNNNEITHKRTRILSNPSNDHNQNPPLLFSSQTNSPSIKRVTRDLSLMEGEMVVAMKEGNVGFPNEGSCSIYTSNPILHHQDYVDQMPMNVIPYSNYFIDAWSADDNNLSSINTNNVDNNEYTLLANHPSLDLSIAMAAGNFVDAQMGQVQFDDDKSSVSWVCGGPLGEALQSGSFCTNPTSSPPATTVSSPSGVLHRTLFSNSDGSVCNSPTFVVQTTDGGAFHRLN